MNAARGSLYFSCLRLAERHLPLPTFCALMNSFAFARATFNTAFKKPRPSAPVPECLKVNWTRRMEREFRQRGYMNHQLQYFPDRLAGPRWRGRCPIGGREHLLKVRAAGRPAVLAFAHFGPIHFMRAWLRADGIPSAALVAGKAADHPELNRLTDGLIRFPEIPTTFYMDQLKSASEFLSAGNLLFVAIDGPASKELDVPFCDGWTFRMAAGPIRLAARHGAELIPCSIIDEGPWRCRIEVGRPVPKEFLADESRWPQAGKYLLDELIPHLYAHPEQCRRDVILRLRKNSPATPPPN